MAGGHAWSLTQSETGVAWQPLRVEIIHWRRVCIPAANLCGITIPPGSWPLSLSATLSEGHVEKRVNEPVGCDRLGDEYNEIGCLSSRRLTTRLLSQKNARFAHRKLARR